MKVDKIDLDKLLNSQVMRKDFEKLVDY